MGVMYRCARGILCVVLICVGALPASAGAADDGVAFFENKVRPVLVEQCYSCHSAEAAARKKLKGGLLLDTKEGMAKGGDNGAVLVPGSPEKSRLIEAVRYTDQELQMPPKGKRLTDQQVADLAEWVRRGAPDPRTGPAGPVAGAIDLAAAKKWWSFQPPREVAPAAVRRGDWVRSPIDAYVLAKLEEKNLSPAPTADRRTLLRRATFDLTGLPPTPAEIKAFCDDASPDAFAKVIDRLLASSAYGERWGRHWLDVARYADTAGDGADYPVREAYKYRNWVIDAFNRDEPYDQFLREQIAGDILAAKGPPEDYARRVTATGFIAVGKRFGYNTNDIYKHLDLADTIDVVGKSVLGLSIGCARCHDHKYDPIAITDYYALYGIFASSAYTFPGGEEHKHPEGRVPMVPPDQQAKLDATRKPALAELDAKIKALTAERAALDAQLKAPAPKAVDAAAVSLEEGVRVDPKRAAEEGKAKLAALTKTLAELTAKRFAVADDAPYPVAYGVAEGKPANARVQLRGEPEKLGAEVPRGFPAVLGGQHLPPDCKGSGRLELANWLTDPANPLTARVMANRIWQYHFGRGIVATPSDYGTRGSPPSHPELLDWLALQFSKPTAEHGCGLSIKAMHRLIMLSATYQMSGADQPAAREADPGNVLLWRFAPRRLESEAIRDAMLTVAGTLDPTPGGEHPFPPVAKWGFSIHNPFYAVYESNRRSVYLMVQRQKRHPFLALFDAADPNVSTDTRVATITPAQALYLMNSPFVHEQSVALAKRLVADAADDAARLKLAHELTQAREPDAPDVEKARAFLTAYRAKVAKLGKGAAEQETSAWAAYARVLLTSNGFLYLD